MMSNYTSNKPTTATADPKWELACVVCDKAIVRDSAEHDQSILVNCGDDIICPDCPRKCKAECGECVVCDSDWSDDDVTDADREEARWEALWEEE